MFGKTKDDMDISLDEDGIDGFFGDEEGRDQTVQFDQLRERVQDVEGQIHSQFTSLAAYAQIAQEQVELVRAESKSATERTERRVTELIERERNDRLSASGHGPAASGVTADVGARLAKLEAAVASITVGINDCLARQKALADAITALFEPHTEQQAAVLPPPASDGPISGLAMPA